MRTSTTHPLRIDHVPAAAGRIGMTFCPGRHQPDAATGAWARDLATDLEAIRAWGATTLVTLVEQHEISALKVTALADEAARVGLDWLHLPIPDAGVPDAAFEQVWEQRAGLWLRELLRRGRDVVVHCKGGLGRTGMIAGRLLVELGEASPDAAIARVRAARKGAIETIAQEAHVRSARFRPAPEYPERVAGCMLAGAIGDALGAGVEFLRLPAIRQRFGAAGVRGYVPAYGRAGAITDDTQMTLFTAEGLIRAWVRGNEKGMCHPPTVVWHAYHRWLVTQGDDSRRVGELQFGKDKSGEWPDGWLVRERRLHSQRAPGNTCLSALRSGVMGSPGERINDSKGCGGVMRAAPAGFVRWPIPRVFELGADIAATTHGQPSGYLAAGCLAAMVAALAEGSTLREALEVARGELARHAEGGEVAAALSAAEALAARGTPSGEELETLGGGWVAEEALAIAVCCALVGERLGEPLEALLLAVNHSGDSDSTGSITGNLLGTLWGRRAAPPELLAELELREVIETLAADLAREMLGLSTRDAEWWVRYPGW